MTPVSTSNANYSLNNTGASGLSVTDTVVTTVNQTSSSTQQKPQLNNQQPSLDKQNSLADQPAPLPEYVVLKALDDTTSSLRSVAKPIDLPLSAADAADIDVLSRKFDAEENCAGLAAPQIGISKRVIVFAAPDDPELKKWRPDFTDSMPKTIWINPTYAGLEEHGYHEDYEACFSVGGVAGEVKRFNKIKYTAYTPTGEYVTGIANGFLARLMQHEIDHLNGILFIDKVAPGKLLTIDAYRKKRQAALQDPEITQQPVERE